jgi:signal peptidase I
MTQVSGVPPVPPASPEEAPAGRRSRRGTVAVLVLLLLAAGTVAVRTFVAVPVRIASDSMQPTLSPGDVVLVSRSAPDVDELRRFDLVAFSEPRTGQRAVKRVVGLPGEDVVILDGVLHVDGRPVEEPWIAPETVDGSFSRTFHVPVTGVLVLGDNRMNSVDSRDYGPVDVEELEGRVIVRLWPWRQPAG